MINKGIGRWEGGAKLLHLTKDGTLKFKINGFSGMQGAVSVNDGKEHIVALTYTVKDKLWTIYLDNNKPYVSKALAPKMAVDPVESRFKVGIEVNGLGKKAEKFPQFKGPIALLTWSDKVAAFEAERKKIFAGGGSIASPSPRKSGSFIGSEDQASTLSEINREAAGSERLPSSPTLAQSGKKAKTR